MGSFVFEVVVYMHYGVWIIEIDDIGCLVGGLEAGRTH